MEDVQKQSDWLTIQEVADRWRTSYDTIRRDVLSGKLPSMLVGAHRRISRKVVEQREREAEGAEMQQAVRRVRRAAAFVASGKDHYPDC